MTTNKSDKRAGWRGLHGVALVGFILLASGVAPFRIWPLYLLVPLMAYAVLVTAVPPMRATFRPWRFGRINGRAVAAALVVALGSSAVLLFFESRMHPDLHGFRAMLPGLLGKSVLLSGVVFSVANALIEELIFRGILFDAAESQWGLWPAVGITSLLFGLGHLHGYPPGPLGVSLACLFALCVGSLRAYTGGLGLPIIVHIVADATIFKILVASGIEPA